ncbi:MAG: 3'-5' exonuclease [Bacteroidia bacterium]|nr:3'-5' exonuclease [Bacteroidia bacterium]
MPYLVLDLEMSGPEPGWNEIIQIGAVLLDDNWKQLGTYLTNVYPENEEAFSIPSEEVHGLTLDELEDAPAVYEVLPEFENWMRKLLNRKLMKENDPVSPNNLKDIVLCGQSIINDINFLRFAYKDQHLDWPFSYKQMDLFTISMIFSQIYETNKKPFPKKLSLTSIAGFFGLERETDTHNALEDAELTTHCFKAYFEVIKKLSIKE